MFATACTPFKMEVQQGNFLAQEAVSQLKPGMTREQVRFLLGSPLVVDPFRDNRWDYVYTRQPANTYRTERRQLSVFFDGDTLAKVEGDVVAADRGATAPRN
ncbi:MAG: outer membrane protein assembly factor BamE [Burkholderiales bacterium]